ncbi:hypothetical protein F4212_13950, partial [Candidatus Poribacteria bacterium]|nr:hypothetical protein [Candidatus Poribacteria bacterium]
MFLIQNPRKALFSQLQHKYSVNVDATWTEEQAEMLLKTYESIYQQSTDTTHTITPSVWKISEETQDDVMIETGDKLKHIIVNSDVFLIEKSYAQNTQDDFIYNQRLFRIVAQHITENWTDIPTVK